MTQNRWLTQVVLLLLVVGLEIKVASSFRPRRIKFAECYDDEVSPKATFLTCANKRGVCELRKGNTHNLRIFFIPEINSTNVESYAAWNTYFQLPLPNQDHEACKFLHRKCPLRASKLTSFTYKLKIDSFWPSKTYPVIWTLTDNDTGENIICLRFKISIK